MKTLSQTKATAAFSRLWTYFVAYIALGSAAKLLLSASGQIAPRCTDNAGASYGACQPCGLHYEMWGMVAANECPDPFRRILLQFALEWPSFVWAIGLVAFPLTLAVTYTDITWLVRNWTRNALGVHGIVRLIAWLVMIGTATTPFALSW